MSTTEEQLTFAPAGITPKRTQRTRKPKEDQTEKQMQTTYEQLITSPYQVAAFDGEWTMLNCQDKNKVARFKQQGYELVPEHPLNDGDKNIVMRIKTELKDARYRRSAAVIRQSTGSELVDKGARSNPELMRNEFDMGRSGSLDEVASRILKDEDEEGGEPEDD